MLGQGIESEKGRVRDKWYSGTLDELRARIEPEDLKSMDEYQRANAATPGNLMHNPVPLEIAFRDQDLARDVMHNIIRATKEQREHLKHDPVIISLQKAKREGMNQEMVLDALGARRTTALLMLAGQATEQVVQPPDDLDGTITIRRNT